MSGMTSTTSPVARHPAIIATDTQPLRVFESRSFMIAHTPYTVRVTRIGSTAYQIDVQHSAGWSRPDLSRLFEKAGCGRWIGRGTAIGSSDSDPRRSAFLYLNELAEVFTAERITPRCATPRRHDARTCGHFRADGTER